MGRSVFGDSRNPLFDTTPPPMGAGITNYFSGILGSLWIPRPKFGLGMTKILILPQTGKPLL